MKGKKNLLFNFELINGDYSVDVKVNNINNKLNSSKNIIYNK